MIGIGFLIRVVQFLLAVVIFALIVVAIVWVVSWAIRITGDILGIEIADTWLWFKSKLPKRHKKKNRKPKAKASG
jgi:hypothetical protein